MLEKYIETSVYVSTDPEKLFSYTFFKKMGLS